MARLLEPARQSPESHLRIARRASALRSPVLSLTRRLAAGLVVVTIFVTALPAAGQLSLSTESRSTAFLQQQMQRDEEARIGAERALPMTQRFAFDYGGWFDWYVFTFNDGLENRTEYTYNVRLWAAMRADEGIHEGYARMW